jgi:hypothetical protein
MPIEFLCSCGRKLQAEAEHVGRRVKCPACGEEMTVPSGEIAVQPAATVPAKPSAVQPEPARATVARPDEDRSSRSSRREDDEDDGARRRRWGDEEDDEAPAGQTTSGKAGAALALGLLSFCLSIVTGLPAVILAFMALNDIKRSHGRLRGQGMALAGLIMGLLTTVLLLPALMIALLVPAVQKVREAASRIQTQNNMRQQVLAMQNYNDVNTHLPEAVPDPKLKGPTKLSWRVEIMPYVEAGNLYTMFHHNEPWDSPHNKNLQTMMPMVFHHPLHPQENAQGLTYFRVFTGNHTAFPPGKLSRIPADFPDGTSNTILIVEAADPVPWTKPDELEYDSDKPLPRLGGHYAQGTSVALADGSVIMLRPKLSETTLRSAIDPNDGKPLGPDWP